MNDFSDLVLTFTDKEMKEHDAEVRSDAIDDFVKTIEKESVILYSWQGQDGIDYECVKMQDIYIKAKQLKERNNG